jgi:hypothetical protein
MKSLEKVIAWLEDRKAVYNFVENGIRAKVLLKEDERIVRVVRGHKGNLIGRVRGSSKVVVFPDLPEITDLLEEGKAIACRIVEKEDYLFGIPLKIQNDPQSGINIFWIERP